MKVSVDPNINPAAIVPVGQRKNNSDSPGLNKACQDFESLFLHQLFKGMRSTGIDGGLFEKGKDQEIFEDLLDTEAANAAAAQNTLGIAQSLLKKFEGKKSKD